MQKHITDAYINRAKNIIESRIEQRKIALLDVDPATIVSKSVLDSYAEYEELRVQRESIDERMRATRDKIMLSHWGAFDINDIVRDHDSEIKKLRERKDSITTEILSLSVKAKDTSKLDEYLAAL